MGKDTDFPLVLYVRFRTENVWFRTAKSCGVLAYLADG